jgi:ribosome biogenesis GTPase
VARKGDESRKSGRKVRIDLRRNRSRTVREKTEWTRRVHEGDLEQDDVRSVESVRTKGEHSRKRTVMMHEGEAAERGLLGGIVVAMRGQVAEVDDGVRLWACTTRRMLRTRLIKERSPLAVGDAVQFRLVEGGGAGLHVVSEGQELPEGVIEEIARRRTMLLRHYGRRTHVIAANVDLALIVVAADQPTLRPHLIDRCLAAVHQGGLRPAVCINKADLDVGDAAAEVARRYASIGYETILTSVVDRRGLDSLRELLTNRISVLFGPSGVGKSSLLNALDPALRLCVGTLTDLQRGRHTTTTARLLKWAFGGYVVDTPGLRQFDLENIEAGELEAVFREFVELIHECRYPNCSHTHEQECAIKTAVEEGRIAIERYESYCKMYEECAAKPKY